MVNENRYGWGSRGARIPGVVREAVEHVLGARVEHETTAPWGSKNRTTIVGLSDGRSVVVQCYSSRDAALVRLSAARQLAEPLNGHGVPVPRVLACDLAAAAPWAAFERLPGEPGYVALGDDLSAPQFPAVARDMGRLVRRIAALDPGVFDLPRLWTDAVALRGAARQWLAELKPHLSAADHAAACAIVDELPALFRGRARVVCHGDYGPQNVLVLGERVSGLLDLEDARLGDPLLDVAWWAWLVRAHTPGAFSTTWPGFLAAAGIDPLEESFDERVQSLIVVRLLETAEAFRHSTPAKHPGWARRLSDSLRWAGHRLA